MAVVIDAHLENLLAVVEAARAWMQRPNKRNEWRMQRALDALDALREDT